MKQRSPGGAEDHFRPEFLNRIDEVIVFHELTMEEVVEIVELLIRRVRDQLEGQGIGMELTSRPSGSSPAGVTSPSSGHGLCGGRSSSLWRTRSRRRSSGRIPVGETVIVDEENGGLVFRAVEGFEPPAVSSREPAPTPEPWRRSRLGARRGSM